MKITITLAFAMAAAFGSVAAAAPAPIVIKFSHSSGPQTAKGQAADMFKKLAEQVTKGRVKVEVYPSLQLLQDKDEIAALQKGDVQMLAPPLARFSSINETEFEAFSLPYLFPDKAAVHRVMDGKIGKDMFQKLEAKGMLGLTYWDDGYMNMSANKPLVAPADLKGLKMRIQLSNTISAEMRALGAEPKMLPLVDVYASLKSGALDGAESPVTQMYEWKMHQVQSHLTISRHSFHSYGVIVNKKFWEGLPADIRSSLENVMAEVTAFERSAAQLETDQALQGIRAAGKTEVYVLSSEEQAAWRNKLAPVQKQMEGRIGKTRIEQVQAEVAR